MLAIVMAGCTKDVHDATLPVPVLFGGVSSEVLITKAVISSDADLAGRTFGVSAFDLNSGNLTEDDGMNLRNASARSSISGGKGVLTLDQKTFYPMGSDAEFSFYSYYPYAETTYGQNRKQAFVTIPVANTTDVLWAFAGGTKGGYNADYISRLFKAHYGKSLKEYMSNVKIDYIKQLLLTSELPLSDVAYNAGFYDYKYFLKFFKYHEGITPTQFLKAYPKTHINKK